MMVQTVISNGQRILRLAKIALPECIQHKLDIQNGRLPDRRAAEICMELEARGFTINSSLRYFDPCSIYQPRTLRASQLELLYQAGFQDLDEPDNRGGHSILSNSFTSRVPHGSILHHTLERSMWFLEKGANIEAPLSVSEMSLRYLLCLHIVRAMARDSWDASRCTKAQKDFRTVLGSLSVSHSGFMKQVF
jgi:hypothetical protein